MSAPSSNYNRAALHELDVHLVSVQRRVNDLLTTLAAIASLPVTLPSSSSSASSDTLQRLSLASAQSQALIEEAFSLTAARSQTASSSSPLSTQASTPNDSSSAFLIHPLVAGYNPTDQVRIKLQPEDERSQVAHLLNAIQHQQARDRAHAQHPNAVDDQMDVDVEWDDTTATNPSKLILSDAALSLDDGPSLESVIQRISSYNQSFNELKLMLLEQASTMSPTSASTAAASAVVTLDAQGKSSAVKANAEKEQQALELKRVMRVMCGKGLRA